MPQNIIPQSPITSLGYNFIEAPYLPTGENEYYLRDRQNRSGIKYRHLSAYEIEVLVRNRNTTDNWNNIFVSDAFTPELVKNCKFFGLVRIGKLEPLCLSFSDLKLPVGLYNSTIISSDFGDNVVIDNVNYLSHFIIGNEAIVINVNELITTNHAKFGNGIVKEGEHESIRIWLEICNENAGRSVIPFNGMLPGDAYLWSKYRDDETLLQKFKDFTELKFNKKRGYYGKVGNRSVIKNCAIIKDVWIGEDAYIKGANKLKNLTINSGEEGRTQIGEGCELVNGIIDYGCRIFYGVKAVRFFMASHSQLKYGARLINSYLGNNATISCCEVLNSLIFPAHEQHHNNSFLCAALVMGQSNVAAGATLGSNHNSRSADGEFIAGRGFWPGLCVSIKHNTKLASFSILSKGDYQAELNIPLPFSLIANSPAENALVIMPAYWFMYNMYALARNSWKYIDRDKRTEKKQLIEYDYLSPDTINEMIFSIQLLEELVGTAYFKTKNNIENITTKDASIQKGKELLEANDIIIDTLEVISYNFENGKRKAVILKARKAYHLFKELISFYAVNQLMQYIHLTNATSIAELLTKLPPQIERTQWQNIGGQLIPSDAIAELKSKIKTNTINSWEDIHQFYQDQAELYSFNKLLHALASWQESTGLKIANLNNDSFTQMLSDAEATKVWMAEGIKKSREKDYQNPYRKMVYDNDIEMENVIGKLEDNSFILQTELELNNYKQLITSIKAQLQIPN